MRIPTYLRDAYRRRLQTRVLACRAQDGGFLAITPDTIVYPGGGGQPLDRAVLEGQPVLSVRLDADAGWVHAVPRPVPVGPALIEVDWRQRFDAMQQHSAQHLITALAGDQLGLTTVAFHLGAERSSIDLDAAEVDPVVLDELLDLVQAEIRAALSIRSRWVEPAELEGLAVRSRGLPADHRGKVRIVIIEGVDRNTCGGTHVASTAELQLVSFLGTERVHGEHTRLHFVAGQRAIDQFNAALERERRLSRTLSCVPQEHPAAVDRMVADKQIQARALRLAKAELAELLAVMTLSRGIEGLAHLHREQDDLPLLQAVARAVVARLPEALVLLTAGEPEGSFLLVGPADQVARLGPELLPLVVGRGGGARGRFQGRAERLDLREHAVEELRRRLVDSS